MNDSETNDNKGADEVYRPRGLAATEHIGQEWKCGVEPRRHRQPGENEERYDDEQDKEVGEPLQNVIMPGFVAAWKAQAQMIDDRASYMSQLPRRWNKLASQVSAHDAVNEIGQAIENQKPSKEKVPAPSRGEVPISR